MASVRWRARPFRFVEHASLCWVAHRGADTKGGGWRSRAIPRPCCTSGANASKKTALLLILRLLPRLLIVLHRFAWSSVSSAPLPVERLHEMAAPWRFNNDRVHLSGILLSTRVHFIGLLEGHECDLDRLWLRLQKDERHRKLMRTEDAACGTRWFPAWRLTCTDTTHLDAEIDALRSSLPSIAARWTQATHQIMLKALGCADRVPRMISKRAVPSAALLEKPAL